MGENGGHPDYGAVELPDPGEEPHEEWSYIERRAYLYREWLDLGTEQLINKSQIADQFGVSRDTIYKDLNRIEGFVRENLGSRHGAETAAVFKKAVKELIMRERYEKAARLQSEFSGFLEDRGAIDKEPDRLEAKTVSADAADDLDEEDLEFLEEAF